MASTMNISFFDMEKARRNLDRCAPRVVGYGRLSFDEDGEGYCSIVHQREILADYYQSNLRTDDSTYRFVADDNVSGYKFERQGLHEILKMIEDGRCNVLLAKDLSRIGRHGALTQLFIEQCEQIGVRIVAMSDYDSQKESDELILGIRTWSNERVVKDTSAKILKIVRHRQSNGTWFCAAPFGYRVLDYAAAQVEIDEPAADIVRRIGRMFVEGAGINRIARIFSEENVATPSMRLRDLALSEGRSYRKKVSSNWTGAQIAKMLDDPFYAGVLVTGRYRRHGINGRDIRTPAAEQHRFPNHHEAIWDRDLWEEIQDIRKGRKEQNRRGSQKNTESLFHGILECGECGCKLYTYFRPDLERQYICSGYFKYGKSTCTRHAVKESTLICIALACLGRICNQSAETLAALDEEVRGAQKSGEKSGRSFEKLTNELEALHQELCAVETQRVRQILRQPDRENLLNEIYDRMRQSAESAIERLQLEMEQLQTQDRMRKDTVGKARTALGIVSAIIRTRDLKRRDIDALFRRIIVHEDGSTVIELKPELRCLQTDEITVNKACEGDPLEIFTDHDGEVVLKKYSPIGEIASIAKDYTESMHRTLGHLTVISDRDAVVSASGNAKKDYAEKAISTDIERIMQDRQLVMLNASAGDRMIPVTPDDNPDAYTAQVVAPIIADGEIVGSLMLLNRENGTKFCDADRKVAETTANIIGKQMEQ